MPEVLTAIGTDASNSFEDLSGIFTAAALKKARNGSCVTHGGGAECTTAPSSPPLSLLTESTSPSDTDEESDNPYGLLIQACDNDPAQILAAYSKHRTARNGLSRSTILSKDFPGPTVDPLLTTLVAASPSPAELIEDDALDPRNCLVFWARPDDAIKRLVGEVQRRLISAQSLGAAVQGKQLWTMPRRSLHLTVLEVTHSTTASAVDGLVDRIGIQGLEMMAALPKTKGVRLGKPFLSYDKAALAVSFLPLEGGREGERSYTYHHLRRDLWSMLGREGVEVDSRYIVPSAHVTVGRFIAVGDNQDTAGVENAMEKWIETIEEVNEWLEREGEEYMCGEDGSGVPWWEMNGLDLRRGRLWYGGGETVVTTCE